MNKNVRVVVLNKSPIFNNMFSFDYDSDKIGSYQKERIIKFRRKMSFLLGQILDVYDEFDAVFNEKLDDLIDKGYSYYDRRKGKINVLSLENTDSIEKDDMKKNGVGEEIVRLKEIQRELLSYGNENDDTYRKGRRGILSVKLAILIGILLLFVLLLFVIR